MNRPTVDGGHIVMPEADPGSLSGARVEQLLELAARLTQLAALAP